MLERFLLDCQPISIQICLKSQTQFCAIGAEGEHIVKRMQVSEPWGYRAMQRALMDGALIITDSGGLHREAAFHQTKCVTIWPLT